MRKSFVKIISIGLLSLLLVSCGKNDTYDQSMQKAKEAINEEKFEEAESFIDLALESRPKEDEAKNYQKQIQSYNKAMAFKKKKETKNAVIKLDEVIKVKEGSIQLVEYAKKEKEKLKEEKDKHKNEKNKENKKDKKSKKEKETRDTLWNTSKADKLREFMVGFSQAMDQDYKEYNQSQNVDLYGIKLPSVVLNGEWKMAVNEQEVQLEWSETGEGNKPYQLVAVYSDADTQPYLKKHVYFFVIENGTPKVFVTQQNQGNDQNYLYFNETQNADIKNGFAQIVNGGQAAKMPEKSSTKEYKDNKLLAAKVLVKQFESYGGNPNDAIDNSTDTTYSLMKEPSMEIWTTGVYLPEDVTIITGSPLAAGMFTYHNNGDGTVTMYPVPSHYQDKDWDDPELGKQMAQEVIDNKKVVDISNVSDEMASKMATIIENDI
ncbi:DUF4767 domain-containing protein [Vagococcus carniphilus]|uniref:DUF4767 domain-containing protein n=1 Tax=Vagococcus carniphilus TaxID=218144 RepID=UPI00288F3613|nr:DUF4767 domain-containing protein [Vagococcus carniphilus]MDT2864237.1 DUF4767 domain-containing protein [Vagococcus carniphilus]